MTDTTARAHTQKALDAARNAAHLAIRDSTDWLLAELTTSQIEAIVALVSPVVVRAYLDALDPAEVAPAYGQHFVADILKAVRP